MTETLVKTSPEQRESGRTKIRWNQEERVRVLAGAARALLKQPNLTPLEAAREGQQVLPESRQPPIPSVSIPIWDWFREALPEAIQWAREHPEETGAVSVSTPDPTPVPDLIPELEPASAPVPMEDPTLEIGPSLPEPPEPLPWVPELLDALARGRNDHLALLDRVGQLERALVGAIGRLEGLVRGGFVLVPAGGHGFTPGAPGVNGFASVGAEIPPLPDMQPIPTAPPVSSDPEPIRTSIRKPRVAVLSIESGKTKAGVRFGCGTHVAQLELWDTPRKYVDFSGFDYVVTTKWTPLDWVVQAQKGPFASKIRHAPGNAREIADYVRALPEIPVK